MLANSDSAASALDKGGLCRLPVVKKGGLIWVESQARKEYLKELLSTTVPRDLIATMSATPVIMEREPLAMLIIREARQLNRPQRPEQKGWASQHNNILGTSRRKSWIPRGREEVGNMKEWVVAEKNHSQKLDTPDARNSTEGQTQAVTHCLVTPTRYETENLFKE